jgi:acetyl esterase
MATLDRLQLAIGLRLIRAPAPIRGRLAGRPVWVDGQRLDPALQLMLRLRELRRMPPLETLDPVRARSRTRAEADGATGRPVPVAAVRDLTVAGLPARHYAPPEFPLGSGPAPLLVYLHGGGFVIGDLSTHDQTCRMLCRHGRMHVLSIDYRLAPEHPYPAAVQDAHAALAWAAQHAAELGADPGRVGIGGDSAGGNLATVVTIANVRTGTGPVPAAQLLIYPATDLRGGQTSRRQFAAGYYLTGAEMDWFQRMYCPDAEETDPGVSPLLAPDLSGLPPAVLVTAGFDPLRDEGEEYAKALRDAGTRVLLRREPDMIHGFVNMVDLSRSARAALIDIAGQTGALLREHPRARGVE